MYWSKRAVVPAGARAGHPVSWYWCQEFPVVEAIGPTECLCQDCETGRRRVRQEGWKPPVDIYGRPALCSHPCWKIVRD